MHNLDRSVLLLVHSPKSSKSATNVLVCFAGVLIVLPFSDNRTTKETSSKTIASPVNFKDQRLDAVLLSCDHLVNESCRLFCLHKTEVV